MGCLNHCSVLHSSLEDQEFLRSQGLWVNWGFIWNHLVFRHVGNVLKCISVPWSGMLSEFSLLSFGDWDIFPVCEEFMINSAFPNLYLEMRIVEPLKYVFPKSSVYFLRNCNVCFMFIFLTDFILLKITVINSFLIFQLVYDSPSWVWVISINGHANCKSSVFGPEGPVN